MSNGEEKRGGGVVLREGFSVDARDTVAEFGRTELNKKVGKNRNPRRIKAVTEKEKV